MCEALKELFEEELEASWNDGCKVGISQGIISALVQLVRDGLLSLSVAAERAQMSVEEFQQCICQKEQDVF